MIFYVKTKKPQQQTAHNCVKWRKRHVILTAENMFGKKVEMVTRHSKQHGFIHMTIWAQGFWGVSRTRQLLHTHRKSGNRGITQRVCCRVYSQHHNFQFRFLLDNCIEYKLSLGILNAIKSLHVWWIIRSILAGWLKKTLRVLLFTKFKETIMIGKEIGD